jgi:hypothetical protein
MKPLRTPSARPELVADPRAYRIVDDPTQTTLGLQGPFGRARCQYALPVNESPQGWLEPHKVVHDGGGNYLADKDGNLVGRGGVYVSRMLAARWTEDTRRLGG